MNKDSKFDLLVEQCAEKLRYSFSEAGGQHDYDFLEKTRFYAALNWLKTDPEKVLKVAQYEKAAAEVMLLAAGAYIGKNPSLSTKTQKTIALLMLNYEAYRANTSVRTRFREHPKNIVIIFHIYGMKRRENIAPLWGDETNTEFSGCDIAAEACRKIGLERPTSYQAVKRIWTNRKKYFHRYIGEDISDEQMIGSISRDINSYIESIALADTKE